MYNTPSDLASSVHDIGNTPLHLPHESATGSCLVCWLDIASPPSCPQDPLLQEKQLWGHLLPSLAEEVQALARGSELEHGRRDAGQGETPHNSQSRDCNRLTLARALNIPLSASGQCRYPYPSSRVGLGALQRLQGRGGAAGTVRASTMSAPGGAAATVMHL